MDEETEEEGLDLYASEMKEFEEEMNVWREEMAEKLKHSSSKNNFLYPMKR